jgi:hypothetical protein
MAMEEKGGKSEKKGGSNLPNEAKIRNITSL